MLLGISPSGRPRGDSSLRSEKQVQTEKGERSTLGHLPFGETERGRLFTAFRVTIASL